MEKGKQEPELFVFDICDTLFYSNTTFDFIRFVLETRKMSGQLYWFNHYTKKSSPVFLGLAVLQKITKTDWPKKLCLKLLQGISRSELFLLGEQFEKQFLPGKIITQTHQMLEKLKAERKKVVLISASLDPVVAAIAKALNVDFRCSELDYDKNGNFTGNLKFEMTGRKLKALQVMLSHQTANFAVATDNFSDFGLVEAACQRYVVVYNEKALNFWQKLNPDFIKLYS
jgi:phosphoserine phosphatase